MNKENKRFIIETLFLKESLKHNLSLNDFLVLMYFDNEYDYTFDVKKVSKVTCLSESDVLSSFGNLLDKNIITLTSEKNSEGKLIDKVSLDNLYSKMKDNNKAKEKQDKKDDLFSKFQEKYGHSLSGMDFELINAWLANGFSEELILGALDEANYNGVVTLRYIDKILFEWQKKGYETMDDVKGGMKNKNSSKYETKVLDFNWLEDE